MDEPYMIRPSYMQKVPPSRLLATTGLPNADYPHVLDFEQGMNLVGHRVFGHENWDKDGVKPFPEKPKLPLMQKIAGRRDRQTFI